MPTLRALITFFGVVGHAVALSQWETNRKSTWGTLDNPTYPKWLSDPSIHELQPRGSSSAPWGARTAANTNPYTSPPVTGVTRKYNFTLSRGLASPDGYQKHVILVNDQFPGPLIEANWGDTIQVTVNNNITGPDEGTALHWHGFLQKGTPWFDGVPSAQQCPIVPGQSLTYSFQADLYGTSWYHSHFSAQYAGGLLGPILVHGPTNEDYDIDLGPIILADWFHKEYFDIVKLVASTDSSNWLQYSDNNLIQGKGNFDCSLVTDGTPCSNNAGYAKFRFQKGKKHLLRLINTSAAGLERFSIDGHTLTVVANDFVPVQPYNATYVTLGVGQRLHVIVEANGAADGAYWMRSNISEICNLPLQPHGLAAIYYDDADTNTLPTSAANFYPGDDGTCTTDPLDVTIPYYAIEPSAPSITQIITVNETVNATGHLVWTIDGSAAHVDYNKAIYLLANEGNLTYPLEPNWNVYDVYDNSSVRLVIQNAHDFSHPIHIHGHNIYILAEGEGTWDNKTVVRPNNPQRRDTQQLRANGYIVIQYETDNPGVWPLHCHIAWHVSMGFYIALIERPDDIRQATVPKAIKNTCTAWNQYTKSNFVDQIDSGV
ncbi:oxydoreductase ptaK [Trichoderma asperellum]|uniref:Oxydoreductase ptaK n=1 Tax=Trichoderma asperellum TaxID=101201 RepID=A0A6V8R3D0_TRIAP|nr:Cupredoxin [Trichoderma asperelloides]GFP58802.1 oxydoreductase ptaK [Trichoderma asperellum]